MAQFMLSVWHDGSFDEIEMSPEEMQETFESVDKFNAKLMEQGKWVFGGGLIDKAGCSVVRADSGSVVVTDGPYSEVKEQMGGFWVINAADLNEALALAKEATVACRGPVEVRPFQDEPEA
jgi:hypothetical protein